MKKGGLKITLGDDDEDDSDEEIKRDTPIGNSKEDEIKIDEIMVEVPQEQNDQEGKQPTPVAPEIAKEIICDTLEAIEVEEDEIEESKEQVDNKQEADSQPEEPEAEVKVSDAFLNLDLKQPSYIDQVEPKVEKEEEEEEEKEESKLELPNTQEEDKTHEEDKDDKGDEEFERDEDYGDENAEDDANNDKALLKVNINVTNTSGQTKEAKETETKELARDNHLLDMLFSFIGASSDND